MPVQFRQRQVEESYAARGLVLGSALAATERIPVATGLVQKLRENGVRDVMIYDDDGLLRIQALGEQPAQILPGYEPER